MVCVRRYGCGRALAERLAAGSRATHRRLHVLGSARSGEHRCRPSTSTRRGSLGVMEPARWSVRLAFEAEISNELMDAMMGFGFRVRIHRMEFRPASADGDEPATVTMELDAVNAQEARILAQHLLGEAQAAAQLAERRSTVVWVAPLADSDESSLRFLGRAKELIDEEDFDLAVVAAQIHLEVQVATLVRRAIAAEASAALRALVGGDRGWPPHDRWGGRVVEAVLDVKLAAFPKWQDYRTHVARRNDVIHSGAPVDQESAEASLSVASDLWLWLNDASQRATPRHEQSPPSPA